MDTFSEISPEQAWVMIQERGAKLADVRDLPRFQYSHARWAFHLTNQSYGQFLDLCDYDEPVIVICYHGTSSRHTAQFLVEQGFDAVFSVKGGFDAWVKAGLPIDTAYQE